LGGGRLALTFEVLPAKARKKKKEKEGRRVRKKAIRY